MSATTTISGSDDTAPSALTTLLGVVAASSRGPAGEPLAPLATYSAAVRGLDRFLADRAMPREVGALRREHIEAFITSILQTSAPATAHNRYRALRSFFGWLVEEGEVDESRGLTTRPVLSRPVIVTCAATYR